MNEAVIALALLGCVLVGIPLGALIGMIVNEVLIKMRKKTVMQQWEQWKSLYPKEYKYMQDYGLRDPEEIIKEHLEEIG